jgi:hypothetical protein
MLQLLFCLVVGEFEAILKTQIFVCECRYPLLKLIIKDVRHNIRLSITTIDLCGSVRSAWKLIQFQKGIGIEWRKKIDQPTVQGSEC